MTVEQLISYLGNFRGTDYVVIVCDEAEVEGKLAIHQTVQVSHPCDLVSAENGIVFLDSHRRVQVFTPIP